MPKNDTVAQVLGKQVLRSNRILSYKFNRRAGWIEKFQPAGIFNPIDQGRRR
jgi:hypothetical protein